MMNGHTVYDPLNLRALPPVVGRHRARVAYPLDATPTVRGPFGRGWECDLVAARRQLLADGVHGADATVAHWIIEAPWSHEIVHSYSLVLIHLRFSMQHAPVVRYMDGATHAIDLYAINPMAPRAQMLAGPINPTMWVPPIAFASQIVESTDEAALTRVRTAVGLVCDGKLSPHPTHVRRWAELFGDCMLQQVLYEQGRASAQIAAEEQ